MLREVAEELVLLGGHFGVDACFRFLGAAFQHGFIVEDLLLVVHVFVYAPILVQLQVVLNFLLDQVILHLV